RSGSGPEFAAEAMQARLRRVGIKPIRIYPGSPWENGYNESFNGTMRRNVLNAEWFTTTEQAQIVINNWLKQYNHTRPHQALNMRPPVPETVLVAIPASGPEIGARHAVFFAPMSFWKYHVFARFPTNSTKPLVSLSQYLAVPDFAGGILRV
ncbi:MAG: transposase, partial [Pseudomonadota bacterium]